VNSALPELRSALSQSTGNIQIISETLEAKQNL